MLKKIASLTGGKYFRATNNEKLKQIYAEIDKLEKTIIEALSRVLCGANHDSTYINMPVIIRLAIPERRNIESPICPRIIGRKNMRYENRAVKNTDI